MRRAGLIMSTVAVLASLVTACGSDSDDDSKDTSVAYGAQTCSDWAGHMDDSEHWDAAKELLTNAKGSDGTEGDKAPSTSIIKQFEADLGTACDKGSSDDLLATVADDLYASNAAYYSL
ncbi:hypothetical protein ABT301_06785 [Streptomyces sp. NPDC000987]|uniref:hypothetical protein n=1 Tax=unclassified Streptomyces TaxID=2593676 RepID=UPI00332625CC